ncbi:hypothetical protein P152DRAFT_14908 [Eremomyces bilateralis CBS 781.70]|uniref:PIN domain-containing protein n=1 Tax=Eremomyces bilateralis CBS 781.70 TaxID=1392243 RepID=A0A6G1GH18_9PEZI|nr:uncharacterized protein P152DRAFT_14908 [Eremomyces bilateralis CBS 781.70]KAF1817304.1 hypothetical protein P152DRAFT_14908 [Eremomyces bilateralis CBS 781.70]
MDVKLPERKVFNCIVDDTALLAGVKKGTRDGIQRWISIGAIRLYVPLHTLGILDQLKKKNGRIAVAAKDTLVWLDEITSAPSVQTSGSVQLQGGFEVFERWSEVENFLLPQTLLSTEEEDYDSDVLTSDVDGLRLDGVSEQEYDSSVLSAGQRSKTPSIKSQYSSTSPEVQYASPHQEAPTKHDSVSPLADADIPKRTVTPRKYNYKSTIPYRLRPLFNHALWRIHRESNPDEALANYILLTNDAQKIHFAQRFGIRAKRLEQLREVIGREDRDYKNRLALYKKENKLPRTPAKPKVPAKMEPAVDDDEEVVLFKRPKSQQSNGNNTRVFDPNAFVRAPQPSRGGRGGRGAGRNHSGFSSRPHSRSGPPAPTDLTKPIDPESYARPRPTGRTGRGGRQLLWDPS